MYGATVRHQYVWHFWGTNWHEVSTFSISSVFFCSYFRNASQSFTNLKLLTLLNKRFKNVALNQENYPISISFAFLQNEYMRLDLPLGVEISETVTRVRLLLFYIKCFVNVLLRSSNIEFSCSLFCVKFVLVHLKSWIQKGLANILKTMGYEFTTVTIIQ